MKTLLKMFLCTMCLLATIGVQAQAVSLCNEKFSSKTPQGWSIQPASTSAVPTWTPDKNLCVSANYSMHGYVPFNNGDTAELVTPYFDCSNYKYVTVQFSHICKVLPSDICEVMYQEQGVGIYYQWKPLPADAYKGKSASYARTLTFNHNAYSEWKGADTFATPAADWWKEEQFDMSDYASYTKIRFKFIIRKGTYYGSFIANGWYVEDFKVVASNSLIKNPVVEFQTTFNDTVLTTGPFAIRAKVASRSNTPIKAPQLVYTTTYQKQTTQKALQMTAVEGDSIWTATIPQQFYGTAISYSIDASDSVGNTARAADGFVLKRRPGITDSNSVAMVSIDQPGLGAIGGKQNVRVSLQNRGIKNLKSAILNWTVNGVLQTPVTWTGDLYSDFNGSITIGNYVQHLDKYDTLRVWVSMPNGVTDNNRDDDTITHMVYGCSAPLKGAYTIGANGNFADIQEAFAILNACGINGNVSLQLADGNYPEIRLSNIGNNFNGYTVTITSKTADANSVNIAGVNLSDCRNLAFTFLRITGKNAVELNGSCYSVAFRHCDISGTSYGIYSNGADIKDLCITSNRIHDGQTAIQLVGSAANTYGKIVIDSNELRSTYYGINMQYADQGSVSHNDIRPGQAIYYIWYGCAMNYCSRIQADGNHVSSSRSGDDDEVEQQYAFYAYNNDSTTFSNNEIILSENVYFTNTGIYMYAGDGNAIINNSIFVRNEYDDDNSYGITFGAIKKIFIL